jgi:hypothetical protein
MSVVVDHQLLNAEQMGMQTVGQVLTHVQRDNRLVVNLLIDGQEPDLDHLGTLKRKLLAEHTLFIETAEPRRVALDALREVEDQLFEGDRLTSEAVDLLQANQVENAMKKLSGCFSTWQHFQESVLKTAQLLRLDLESVTVEDRSLAEVVREFRDQLQSVKQSLEARDYVSLCDILTYEIPQGTERWRAALETMREIIL